MPAAFLESKIGSTAELLERAYDHGAWIVALDVFRSGGPDELLGRATLLQERVWQQREGLARLLRVER